MPYGPRSGSTLLEILLRLNSSEDMPLGMLERTKHLSKRYVCLIYYFTWFNIFLDSPNTIQKYVWQSYPPFQPLVDQNFETNSKVTSPLIQKRSSMLFFGGLSGSIYILACIAWPLIIYPFHVSNYVFSIIDDWLTCASYVCWCRKGFQSGTACPVPRSLQSFCPIHRCSDVPSVRATVGSGAEASRKYEIYGSRN